MNSKSGVAAGSPAASAGEGELRKGAVGFVGLLAQSVAGIGPSIAIALILGLIAGTSGNGAWLSWLISTLIVIAVAICISQFARRFVTSGGLYVLNAQATPGLGLVTAWAALLFSLGSAPILPMAFGIFFVDFLKDFGLPAGPLTLWVSITACIIGATFFAWRDIGVSAIVMLVIEVVSLLAILILMIVVGVHHADGLIDAAQISLQGVSVHDIAQGVVLSLLAFAAFESALFLGKEATHPLREMSRAITGAVIICGVLFIVFTYLMTIGFSTMEVGFAKSANPLHDLAAANGVGGLSYLIQPGVIISLFAVTIANLNFSSRLLMTLSRERLLPGLFQHVDARTHTPSTAIFFVAGIDLVATTLFVIFGVATFDTFGVIGTLSSYWVGITYVVTCIAMIVFLRRRRELTPGLLVLGIIGTAAFAYFFWTSAVPTPPWPWNAVFYVFLVSMILALVHWAWLAARRSPTLDRFGSSASTTE
jgi:amino acid transporter